MTTPRQFLTPIENSLAPYVHFPNDWLQILETSLVIQQDNLPEELSEGLIDFCHMSKTFLQTGEALLDAPEHFTQVTSEFWSDFLTLCACAVEVAYNPEIPLKNVITPEISDRRFSYSHWESHPVYNFIKQNYLLHARWLTQLTDQLDHLDPSTQNQFKFYTQQLVNALAPSNFPLTNPQVMEKTMSTQGKNLMRGLVRLARDLEEGKDLLHICNVDLDAFELGRNLAITPGKVIYQNDLMQLIQYTPTTPQVNKVPLFIIPAWINKFYIFDLQPHNSFVKWAVDQGHTVFIISWVNPTEQHADKTFEDYMLKGPLAALEVVRKITDSPQVNAVGYCLGGILLTTLLGYLGKQANTFFKSATFLASLVDFSKAGEMLFFTNPEQFARVTRKVDKLGYLDASTMQATFNLLRANDLIWSSFVNLYLLDETAPQHDMLYWNADPTNLPGMMYRFYVEQMFQKNSLIQPGSLSIAGIPIDLRNVEIPAFILGTAQDHIAPWASVYPATQLFSGPNKFVLSESGHVAGVINPPTKKKYGFWATDQIFDTPEDWLAHAEKYVGSWWNNWNSWVSEFSDGLLEAQQRIPGAGPFTALEDAPGSYVRVRAKD